MLSLLAGMGTSAGLGSKVFGNDGLIPDDIVYQRYWDEGVSGADAVDRTIIAPEMEEKILWSRRKNPNKNEVIGGHSSGINNDHPNYAAEVIKTITWL